MAEILGLGCSHGPIILTPPEVWSKGRERIFARVPNYEPPPQLLKELGDDNGLSQDRKDHEHVITSFGVLRDRLHAWNPDVLLIIGDDQAENFTEDNIAPFCLYTGAEVGGYPFQRPAARVNLWDAAPDTKFTFTCPTAFARDLRNALIRDGVDMASSKALTGWEWGLPHAHINPLVFLDPDGVFPLLPLFVNCYGEEAGPDYPPRPTPQVYFGGIQMRDAVPRRNLLFPSIPPQIPRGSVYQEAFTIDRSHRNPQRNSIDHRVEQLPVEA